MDSAAGFEPATLGLGNRYSGPLSYAELDGAAGFEPAPTRVEAEHSYSAELRPDKLAGEGGVEPPSSEFRARCTANCATPQWLTGLESNQPARVQSPLAHRLPTRHQYPSKVCSVSTVAYVL